MSALVVDAVVRDSRITITHDGYHSLATKAAKKWGDGTALKVRIEPEEDAYTYDQLKFYWGQVIQPFAEWTGYYKHEAHVLLKAECMPDGKTSITQLSRQGLRDYTEAAEQTAREWCPEAFALMEPRQAA